MTSKQDYEGIARAIKEIPVTKNLVTKWDQVYIHDVVEALSEYFQRDNMAFSPSKFREACTKTGL